MSKTRSPSTGPCPRRHGFRDPKAAFLAFGHQLQTLCPSRDNVIQPECRRLMARCKCCRIISVGGPSGVIHRNRAGCLGMSRAGADLQNLVAETSPRSLGIGGRSLDVVRRFRWINRRFFRRSGLKRNQFDVEHQHSGRSPFLSFVGQLFRNPESAFSPATEAAHLRSNQRSPYRAEM